MVLSQCPCHLHLVPLLHTRTFKQLSIEALLIVTIYNNITSLYSRDYNDNHNHPENNCTPMLLGEQHCLPSPLTLIFDIAIVIVIIIYTLLF